MDGPKALGGPGGGTGGRPHEDMDLGGLEIPENKLTSWIGRFAKQRRGSVGFSDNQMNLSVPLSRMDEDSNSGTGDHSSPLTVREDTGGVPFGRKRDISFSDLQTPGGDGDTFVHLYRRRQSEDFVTQQPDMNLLKYNKDDGLKMEIDSSTLTKDGGPKPATVQELLTNVDLSQNKESDHLTASHYGVGVQEAVGRSDEPPSVFLIDLETVDEGGKIKLAPQSKKFSAARLFQNGWAQNWFFRNDEAEDGEKEEIDRKISEISVGSDRSSSEEKEEESLSFAGKFRQAAGDHPRGLREMNTWQPQGF